LHPAYVVEVTQKRTTMTRNYLKTPMMMTLMKKMMMRSLKMRSWMN